MREGTKGRTRTKVKARLSAAEAVNQSDSFVQHNYRQTETRVTNICEHPVRFHPLLNLLQYPRFSHGAPSLIPNLRDEPYLRMG